MDCTGQRIDYFMKQCSLQYLKLCNCTVIIEMQLFYPNLTTFCYKEIYLVEERKNVRDLRFSNFFGTWWYQRTRFRGIVCIFAT